MPSFKAKFRKGLRVEPGAPPITLTLGVSMDCVQQSGEQLAAFLGLVVEHRSVIANLQIVCSDDLYRHYHGWTESTTESERTTMVDRLYNDWLKENWKYLSFFRDTKNALCGKTSSTAFSAVENQEIAALFFGPSNEEDMARAVEKLRLANAINLEIIRWRTLLNTPEYAAAKQQVDAAYRDNSEFKKIVASVAAQHSKEKSVDTVIAFLLEETAVFIGPLKNCQLAYSSPSFNQAILWAIVNIAHQSLIYHGYSLTSRKQAPLDSIAASSSVSRIPPPPPGEIGEIKGVAMEAELVKLSLASFFDSRRGGTCHITVGNVAIKFELNSITPTHPSSPLGKAGLFSRLAFGDGSAEIQNPKTEIGPAPE